MRYFVDVADSSQIPFQIRWDAYLDTKIGKIYHRYVFYDLCDNLHLIAFLVK